jgi:hypothetical protein
MKFWVKDYVTLDEKNGTEKLKTFFFMKTNYTNPVKFSGYFLNTVFDNNFQQNPDLRIFKLIIDLKYRNNAFPSRDRKK